MTKPNLYSDTSKVVRVGRANKARLDNLKKLYGFKSYGAVVEHLLNVHTRQIVPKEDK
jgi:hypothetical protein